MNISMATEYSDDDQAVHVCQVVDTIIEEVQEIMFHHIIYIIKYLFKLLRNTERCEILIDVRD